MAATEQVEIETKYDVDAHAVLPALHELPGVASVAQPVELQLQAVYFDTADYDLAAARVTLRRRTGGEDDGWHVKLPISAGERLEIHHPLGRAVRKVPIQVVRTVRVHVRDRELVPVVTLETRRIVHRLLDTLDELLTQPPLTEESPRKAAKQLPELLKHDWKRMRKAVRRAQDAESSAEQDHELHEVRKAAKRLRYAAESAEPVLGAEATEIAAVAEQVQEVLGEHQDSVVARDLLRQLAVQVHLDGGNAFTFGRLHAAEEQRGETSYWQFLELWPTLHVG